MKQIFNYNGNGKYSTKDLNGGYIDNNFSVMDVYLNQKRPFSKMQ